MACEICHEIYMSRGDGQNDSDVKPHLCTTCGQSFSLKIQLKRHTLLHADGAPYTCVNCLNVNDSKGKTYNLRLGNKNEYPCDICQKCFPNKRMLLRHSIQHTFDKNSDVEDYVEEKVTKKSTVAHKRKLSRKNSDKKELLSCKNCDKTFQTWLSLEKHALTHNVIKSTKTLFCKKCSKSFAYQACLDKHIKKGKCNSSSVSNSVQKEKSTESGSKKHTCNICGKTFARKSSLEGHELSHILDRVTSEEEKDFSDGDDSDEYISQPKKSRVTAFNFKKSYTCDKCTFMCFSKLTLNKHLANHVEKEKFFTEARKGKMLSSDENDDYSSAEDKSSCEAKGSKKNKINESMYECNKCVKKFETKEKLHKHYFVHNKNEPNSENENNSLQCEICEKEFYSKKDLKRHLLFHVERTSDNSFSDDSKWGKQSRHRNKKFICEICGRRFAGETCLKKHSLRHNLESEDIDPKPSSVRIKKPKPVKELICEFCNEEFTGKRAAYMKHIHAHTPEVCGICDERFVDRQSLREHCKIHVGTEEGRMFMQCSQKALDAKNGLAQQEPKVEYIYLVLR